METGKPVRFQSGSQSFKLRLGEFIPGKVVQGTILAMEKRDGKDSLYLQLPQGRTWVEATTDFHIGQRILFGAMANGEFFIEEQGQENPTETQNENVKAKIQNSKSSSTPGGDYSGSPEADLKGELVRYLESRSVANLSHKLQVKESPATLSLPQVIKEVLQTPNGPEVLLAALKRMAFRDPHLLLDLAPTWEADISDYSLKQTLRNILKEARSLSGFDSMQPSSPDRSKALTLALQAASEGDFKQANALVASYTSPTKQMSERVFFGRVQAEIPHSSSFQTPSNITTHEDPSVPTLKSDASPNMNYRLDLGGIQIDAISSQPLSTGDFIHFNLRKDGQRYNIQPLNPGQLPDAMLNDFKALQVPVELQSKLTYQVAWHHLSESHADWTTEAFFGPLLKDLSATLENAKLIHPESLSAMPKAEVLDGFIRLIAQYGIEKKTVTELPVENPQAKMGVEPKEDEVQAATWLKGLQNPESLSKWLDTFTLPETHSPTVLTTNTPLQLKSEFIDSSNPIVQTIGQALEWLTQQEIENSSDPTVLHSKNPSHSARPDGVLPSDQMASFTLDDLYLGLSKLDESPLVMQTRHTLESLLAQLPRNAEDLQSSPQPAFFWNHGAWTQVDLRWNTGADAKGNGKPTRSLREHPLRFDIAMNTHHMGKVRINLKLEEKGARLNFRNQKGDVRELLGNELKQVEKDLAHMDFRFVYWECSKLEESTGTKNYQPNAPIQNPRNPNSSDGGIDVRG